MSESDVYKFLLEKGCCRACSLRFLRDRNINLNDLDNCIQKKNLQECCAQTDEGPHLKKCKANPCCVCLNLLNDPDIDAVVDQILLSDVQKYDSKSFCCVVSLPTAVLIREHAMALAVQSSFAEFYKNSDAINLPLNKAWKLIIAHKLTNKLSKIFDSNSNLLLYITMDYCDNEVETAKFSSLISTKISKDSIISRKSINGVLDTITREQFLNIVNIPPPIPENQLTCKLVECKHNPIYVAGRYCKYSRDLCQTPWFIDNKRYMESSVEEIIFEQISKLFDVPMSNLKFTASGREDCDVRCIGKGRPFYIEVSDPKKTFYTFADFRKLETEVNHSTLIKVRDMQIVQREELGKIKEGEQNKTKDYLALCRAEQSLTQELIDKINNLGTIELQQRTPMRVLHRRPVMVRSRKIYTMQAKLIPDKSNLFELNLVTAAGAYVKEFVHGDFGRTKPNLGNLLGVSVDIIALDVIAINLDWPKEVNCEEGNTI